MNGNVHQDMLRQNNHPQPPMMGINGGQFLQNGPPPVQQHQGLGMPPNTTGHPPMGMLAGGPPNPGNAMNSQRFPMQMGQGGGMSMPQQRGMIVRPNTAQMSSQAAAHLGGMGHNQMQGMQYPGNMVGQGNPNLGVRRVTSQPSLNSGSIPQGINNLSMGMNPQNSMPAHLRQVAQQQQQNPQMRGIAHMPPELNMGMNRPGPNSSLVQNGQRVGPPQQMQLMSSLPQPPSMGSNSGPGGIPSNSFQNGVPLPMQHQAQQISSSPRPPSHPQSHTPSMSMNPQRPSPPQMHRISPDNNNQAPYGMNFNNPQFQPGPSSGNRIPGNNGQFPFMPSSPPNPGMHLNQGGLEGGPGPGSRPGFQLTPAQQYEQIHQPNGDAYSFSVPSSSVPTQPNHHQIHQQHSPQSHQSPPADNMNAYPPRPQSRLSRPPSTGRASTPRQQAANLPGRIPSLPPNHASPLHHVSIAPRPSQSQSGPSSPPDTQMHSPELTMPSASSSGSAPGSDGANVPRPLTYTALGAGQGLIRLIQFSANLASDSPTKMRLHWWDELIDDFFMEKSTIGFTLWKDNARNEAKLFEIGVQILPRFFLVTTQSGVKSMTLTLDGARERAGNPGRSIIECVAAAWTYKYTNGYTVTLRGPLTAQVVAQPIKVNQNNPATNPNGLNYVLKFEEFRFEAHFHDKAISLDAIIGVKISPELALNPPTNTDDEEKKWEDPRIVYDRGTSIPGEPVNAFGIPQATMRCLELAESVGQMADLITFASSRELGPLDALSKFAHKLREGGIFPAIPQHGYLPSNGPPPAQWTMNSSGAAIPMGLSLFQGQPSLSNPPPPANMTSPSQNTPGTSTETNSPQKQLKSIPPPSASGSGGTTNSNPASTTNTPAVTGTSMKRKASVSTSPATLSEQAPTKRTTRRGRRGAGG